MNVLKWLVPVGIIGVVLFSLVGWVVGFKNTAVRYEEDAKNAWGGVESSYQRRNDLIGSLVKTVQGAAKFEKSTLTAVIEARAKATSVTIDPSKATPEQMESFQRSQSSVNSSLSRLLVSVEQYPELKANENFLRLQTEIVGTENRINMSRNSYNTAIKPYNIHIKELPNSILAGFFGLKEMAYYKADPGSEKAPSIEFNFD